VRRLCLVFVVLTLLAGCSSGPSPASASTKFCAAFVKVKAAKASQIPKTTGDAFVAAAADMRAYAPAAIKAPTSTYADLLENVGQSAQAGGMDEPSLQQALATGMADKASDIAKVAVWVSKNCPR